MTTRIEVMLSVIRGPDKPACYRVTRYEHCGVDEALERVRHVLRNTRERIRSKRETLLEEQIVVTRTVEREVGLHGRYVIVQVGKLEDGREAYQVFQRERDFNHEYYVPCNIEGLGSILPLNEARRELDELMQDEVVEP